MVDPCKLLYAGLSKQIISARKAVSYSKIGVCFEKTLEKNRDLKGHPAKKIEDSGRSVEEKNLVDSLRNLPKPKEIAAFEEDIAPPHRAQSSRIRSSGAAPQQICSRSGCHWPALALLVSPSAPWSSSARLLLGAAQAALPVGGQRNQVGVVRVQLRLCHQRWQPCHATPGHCT